MSPLSFVVPLGRSDIGVIHQLRYIVDILSVFDQGADERGPSTVRGDSLLLINLLRPLSDDMVA